MRPLLQRGSIGLAVLFALVQAVPYGRSHENPPVRLEPTWDAPGTRALAKRACFDCHSNETDWPWYSWVAPVSWLVEHDVVEGREYLNFSEWDREQEEADEAPETIAEGEMPPRNYLLAHPGARLTAEERTSLIDGLRETIGKGDEGDRGRRRRGRD